jgi:mycofactocin precursor peptide peptidase
MLAIDPRLVHLDLAARGRTEPIAELMTSLRSRGVIGVSPNGVLGDPAGANADEGRELLAAMIADLARRVDAWRI